MSTLWSERGADQRHPALVEAVALPGALALGLEVHGEEQVSARGVQVHGEGDAGVRRLDAVQSAGREATKSLVHIFAKWGR